MNVKQILNEMVYLMLVFSHLYFNDEESWSNALFISVYVYIIMSCISMMSVIDLSASIITYFRKRKMKIRRETRIEAAPRLEKLERSKSNIMENTDVTNASGLDKHMHTNKASKSKRYSVNDQISQIRIFEG